MRILSGPNRNASGARRGAAPDRRNFARVERSRLLPRAVAARRIELLAPAFIGGGVTSIMLSELVGSPRNVPSGTAMVLVAAATGLAVDGTMTGAGSSVAASLGLLLAGNRMIGDFPNGFAAMMPASAWA